MEMESRKKAMIMHVINNYPDYTPCTGCGSLFECFEFGNYYGQEQWALFFNASKDGGPADSSHIITESMLKEER